MIKLQVIGHLGKDCVVSNHAGKNVINFSVCHTEKYKDAQGVQKEKSVWVEASWWSERIAIAPYLKKGTQVYVEGQADVRAYTTNSGQQGASLTLRVQNVQLLGGKQEGGGNGQQNQPAQHSQSQSAKQYNDANEITEPSDDLPF